MNNRNSQPSHPSTINQFIHLHYAESFPRNRDCACVIRFGSFRLDRKEGRKAHTLLRSPTIRSTVSKPPLNKRKVDSHPETLQQLAPVLSLKFTICFILVERRGLKGLFITIQFRHFNYLFTFTVPLPSPSRALRPFIPKDLTSVACKVDPTPTPIKLAPLRIHFMNTLSFPFLS